MGMLQCLHESAFQVSCTFTYVLKNFQIFQHNFVNVPTLYFAKVEQLYLVLEGLSGSGSIQVAQKGHINLVWIDPNFDFLVVIVNLRSCQAFSPVQYHKFAQMPVWQG